MSRHFDNLAYSLSTTSVCALASEVSHREIVPFELACRVAAKLDPQAISIQKVI